MLGFIARLVGGALDPLIDQVTVASARLLRKLALFAVAGVCLVVVVIALTIAFDLWIASRLGAIAGALGVACLYFIVAITALALALRKEKPKSAPAAADASGDRAADGGRAAQVDAFAAPLMAALSGLGLKREQLAVLAGSSLAKQLGPLPLVGLALVGGFLLGRVWRSWRTLVSTDAIVSLLALFGVGQSDGDEEEAD